MNWLKDRARVRKNRFALMVVLASTIFLGGCFSSGVSSGAGGKTTCAEFLALALPLEDLLAGKRSEEQDAIIKKALADRGLDAGYAGNLYVADMKIQDFCGMKNYPVTINSDRPIEDAFD